MSYTEIDWLRDQTRTTGPFTREANDHLVTWLREDARAIIRRDEHDALILHMKSERHDHELCEMAEIHWDKEKGDWT